ncbi:DUF433 domain-containing protein [Candidatus Woesearchaeota archaeon]|nr:DUF433 domain-containing protein [Candidatus Woesearchaeota archaeon]
MEVHIVVDPHILAGKPVIKGTRIPVSLVLNLLANGKTREEIIEEYPELTKDDITAAISYAASAMNYEELDPMEASG